MESDPFIPKTSTGPSSPSAPPATASTVSPIVVSGKVVQPFSIGGDEVIPVAIIDGGETAVRRTSYQALTADTAMQLQSEWLNNQIEDGNYDGFKIVHRDREVALKSTVVGSINSQIINSKLEAANRDRVDDLTIKTASTAMPHSLDDIHISSTSSTHNLHKSSYESYHQGGYQISEYKSMYEENGSKGYQFSEYKSIYD